MAAINIDFQAGDVVETLKFIEAGLADPSEIMRDVLLVMIRSTQLNFDAQGRPAKWAPLAQSTILHRLAKTKTGRTRLATSKRLAKKGGSGPAAKKAGANLFASAGSLRILQDTGLLLQSVGGDASGAFSTGDGFGESDQTTAIIGTNNVAAYNHWPDPRTGRPERLIFVWQDADEEDVMAMAEDFVLHAGPYA
jgi:phage gpG-like protein